MYLLKLAGHKKKVQLHTGRIGPGSWYNVHDGVLENLLTRKTLKSPARKNWTELI